MLAKVPAHEIEDLLKSRGFIRSVQRFEVVYTRASVRNPSVKVKVYTSIKDGRQAVRAAGKDAIRVCVIFDDGRKTFGVGKFAPVFRVASVDSVKGRIVQRLQSAAKRANEWLDQQGARPVRATPSVNRGQDPHWIARMREKAACAQQEREQEARAFLSDPDYQNLVDPEVALAHHECGLSDAPPPYGEP